MLSDYQRQISSAIKKARLERQWNQKELAQKLGISQSRLSEIENSKGSITAEQLIVLMQTFNLALSYFVKTKVAGVEGHLQNAIARLGVPQLKENADILPSEELTEIHKVIVETIVHGASARLIMGLVVAIIRNAQHINFNQIHGKLIEFNLGNRLRWIIDGTLRALNRRLNAFVPRERSLLYRRAQVVLSGFFRPWSFPSDHPEDLLDPDIASQKTLESIKESRDELAKKWHIITRIREEDFYNALMEAEKSD